MRMKLKKKQSSLQQQKRGPAVAWWGEVGWRREVGHRHDTGAVRKLWGVTDTSCPDPDNVFTGMYGHMLNLLEFYISNACHLF